MYLNKFYDEEGETTSSVTSSLIDLSFLAVCPPPRPMVRPVSSYTRPLPVSGLNEEFHESCELDDGDSPTWVLTKSLVRRVVSAGLPTQGVGLVSTWLVLVCSVLVQD